MPAPLRLWSWLAMAMSVLDASIANIALPTIATDLGASASSSVWVVNAYQIAIVTVLLPLAALGEIVTYRRVYLAGLGLFLAASSACALSQDLVALSVARFVQGLGAAGIMAVNGALVRFTYPRSMLGRGIGLNALVVGLTSAMGPSVAAAILSVASWKWLFAINVPIGLLALAIGARALPRPPAVVARFDVVAAYLSACAFASFFLACAGVAHGAAAFRTAIEAGLALLAALLLVRRSARLERPVLPLDLIRMPVLRSSYAISAFAFAAQAMVLVGLPFHLERALHLGSRATALIVTAMPAGTAFAAPIAGRVVERISPGRLGGLGLSLLAAGFLLLSVAPSRFAMPASMLAMAIAGFGFGLFQTPNNRTMLGCAPRDRSGAAAGMQGTARLFGQTLGALAAACALRLAGPGSGLPMTLAVFSASIAAAASLARRDGDTPA